MWQFNGLQDHYVFCRENICLNSYVTVDKVSNLSVLQPSLCKMGTN